MDIGTPSDSTDSGGYEVSAESQHEVHAAERTLAEMGADEETRLQKENEQDVAFDEELELDENSDWLRGCGWPLKKPVVQHVPH